MPVIPFRNCDTNYFQRMNLRRCGGWSGSVLFAYFELRCPIIIMNMIQTRKLYANNKQVSAQPDQ